MTLNFGNLTYHLWEKLFRTKLSLKTRLMVSLLIALTAFAIAYFLKVRTGNYFSFIVIMAALGISLFAGEKPALVFATCLSVVCDYFLIPPVGGIFENQKSVEHFLIIFATSLVTVVFVGTLRTAFTRLSAAKEEADTASVDARSASQQMERVLALVSHDVRNPLATSILASQLLLEEPNRVDRQSLLAMISRNLYRADELIQSLLDVASIRSSGRGIKLTYHHCDLRSQLNYLMDELEIAHKGRLIFIAGEPVWGNWATDGIRRAMENMINNALKYGSPEFPIIVSLTRDHNAAVLSVHNQGNEIEPADQERLFDFFNRGTRNDDNSKGWGIGLAVVKAVAEAHGGRVGVESGKGLGTKFILTVPSHEEAAQASAPHLSPA